MADLALPWNGDLSLSGAGDLALVDDDDRVRQRIQRRLFTAVHAYVFHLDYGAGLPQKIGETFQPMQIESIVRAQLLVEESVSQVPPPTIAVAADASGLTVIDISYAEAPSGRQIGLTISI